MRLRGQRHLVAAGALALVAGALVCAGAGSAAPEPATFSIRVDEGGRGSFTARGAVVDRGRALVRRAVANGRLHTTATLTGAKGRIVLASQQRCGLTTGTWRVDSGTLGYAALRGRGMTIGRAACTRPFRAATLTYRGSLDLPPPALATPGPWGGSTTQGSAILFTVTPDGRSLGNVLVGNHRYECVRSDGLRSPAMSGTDTVYSGPFAIADDRTFSFKAGFATIAGRFGPADAQGMLTISQNIPADPQGRTTTCSASLAWTATNPAPPAKRALAGTYCGFASGGGGVCVDVVADGRQARNVRTEIVLTCGIVARIPVRVTVTYDQPMPLRTDLFFRGTFTTPFDGGTVSGSISGTFDESGSLRGNVGLSSPAIVRDGTRHICRGNGAFTAQLQR